MLSLICMIWFWFIKYVYCDPICVYQDICQIDWSKRHDELTLTIKNEEEFKSKDNFVFSNDDIKEDWTEYFRHQALNIKSSNVITRNNINSETQCEKNKKRLKMLDDMFVKTGNVILIKKNPTTIKEPIHIIYCSPNKDTCDDVKSSLNSLHIELNVAEKSEERPVMLCSIGASVTFSIMTPFDGTF